MKEILFFIFLGFSIHSGFAQKPKSTHKTQSQENSLPIVNCYDLVDNPEKYIGKTFIVSLGYLSTSNRGMGLRKYDNDSYERALSIENGFYSENDLYNTRIVDCNGSSNIYMRIPKNSHSTFPNSQSGYFYFGGTMKDKNTFIAVAAERK